jgi:hypothetical protein
MTRIADDFADIRARLAELRGETPCGGARGYNADVDLDPAGDHDFARSDDQGTVAVEGDGLGHKASVASRWSRPPQSMPTTTRSDATRDEQPRASNAEFPPRLGCRDRMSPGDVKEKWTELLQRSGKAAWPPPVGHWSPDRVWFVVTDGRHEYLAALMHGQESLFVAWVEQLPNV